MLFVKEVDRPVAGVEVEFEPQIELGSDFRTVVASDIRETDSSHENRVGTLASGPGALGEITAVLGVEPSPAGVLLQRERDAR